MRFRQSRIYYIEDGAKIDEHIYFGHFEKKSHCLK